MLSKLLTFSSNCCIDLFVAVGSARISPIHVTTSLRIFFDKNALRVA